VYSLGVTATDCMISWMEGLDDAKDIMLIIRREDGCISFDSMGKSRFDSYAMVCATKATLEASIVKTEMD